MRLFDYLKEAEEPDKDPELEYEKAVFDLYVALKTKGFMKGEQIPLDPPERRFAYLNKKVSLVKKIITQAEKVRKMAEEGSIEIDDNLKKVLDKIPTKEEVKDVKVPFRLDKSAK